MMVLRSFILFAGILRLGLISWPVNLINERLIAKTLYALAGLCFIFAMMLGDYISRKIKERWSGRIFHTCPEERQRFDSIRLGSDAMGIFFLSEVRTMMESGGKGHEHPNGDAA